MKLALKVTAEGTISKINLNEGNEYETLRSTVGGLIQAVDLDDQITLWCNEEGKLIGLPYNDKATQMWENTFGLTDLIMGDTVFTGGTDDEGETLPLSIEQIQKIKNLIGLEWGGE